jgi:hypothetical protein
MQLVKHIPDQGRKNFKKCQMVGTSRGKLEKKEPRSEISFGTGWKTYTIRCVNLTFMSHRVCTHLIGGAV